ncbi:MAG TPA: hypothetical protein VLW85_09195 [Myxococcales bacterium]|nr:hypothetical protein [Myxococcales bacterium]
MPQVRVAEMACGAAKAVAVEVALSTDVRVSATASDEGADLVIDGGLLDARERPMGPARGDGRDWPAAHRRACSGVLAAAPGASRSAAPARSSRG